MLVSQYIYTACGKDRNGAFSLFSKSADITDAEHSEIREMMMYKVPANLPIEPTEQEIEEQFPKKFAYFFLSSGRACIAQACYVGKVYSDNDHRTGNYIIHAIVFDKDADISPYNLVQHETFKRSLTRKEWHDDPIPDALPPLEITENGIALTQPEITAFFNPDRQKKLKLLVEALINPSPNNTVHLKIEPQEQIYWLKALNHCIPKAILSKISVCSFFINSIIEGNISSKIQLRINRPEGNQFNYAQDIQRDRPTLDFVKGLYPASLKPSKFTETIVDNLVNGKDFFKGVVLFITNLNKILTTYPVNINQATDLTNLSLSNYPYFLDADELFQTIMLADRVGFETTMIAENTWKNMAQLPPLSIQQRLDIMKYVYKTLPDMGIKLQIIGYVFDNTAQLEIGTTDVNTFADSIKAKAAFVLENYLDYVKSKGLANYITQNQNTPYRVHFLFDFLTKQEAVKNAVKTASFNLSDETKTVKEIMNSAYNKKDLQDIDLLASLANKNSPNQGVELLTAIVKSSISTKENMSSIPFAFEILSRLYAKKEVASEYLWCLIELHQDKDEMIAAYINAQKQRTDFFNDFEKENKDKELMGSFSRKKDAYRFTNQDLDMNAIKKYYVKYYITGDDTGILVKRLPKYLSGLPSERKLAECDALLKEMSLHAEVKKPLLTPIYLIVFNTIFDASVPFRQIQDKCRVPDYIQRINDTYNTLKQDNITIDQDKKERYYLLQCGNTLTKCSKDEQSIRGFISRQTDDAAQIAPTLTNITPANITIVIDNYFPIIAKILVLGYSKNAQYEDIVVNVFGKVLEKGNLDKILDGFTIFLEKSNNENTDFVIFLLRKRIKKDQTPLDKQLSTVAYEYIIKLKYQERQDILEKLKIDCTPEEQKPCQEFIDKINKEHPKKKFLGLF